MEEGGEGSEDGDDAVGPLRGLPLDHDGALGEGPGLDLERRRLWPCTIPTIILIILFDIAAIIRG